jgi:hypothetical protein
MLIPAAVEKVRRTLSYHHTVEEGIAALRRQRKSLSIVDEIAIAEHRLQVNSDADRRRVREKIMQLSYDVLRHDSDRRGEVVAQLKTSAACSAYIMHDGILGASLRARLRLRRTFIDYHRYRLDVLNRMPNCSHCADTLHGGNMEHAPIEGMHHVLIACPQYCTVRQQLIDGMHQREIDIAFTVENILCSDHCLASLRSRQLREEWLSMTERYIVSIFHVRGIL